MKPVYRGVSFLPTSGQGEVESSRRGPKKFEISGSYDLPKRQVGGVCLAVVSGGGKRADQGEDSAPGSWQRSSGQGAERQPRRPRRVRLTLWG